MRADRLLSLLITLQTHRQVSAMKLAEQFGVSVRTIYRDVEALTLVGIPVYTMPGRGGGIALDEAYHMALSGLSSDELYALVVTDTRTPLRQLGLGGASDTVLKLLSMTSNFQQHSAAFVRERLFIDPTSWFGEDISPYLLTLQQAIWEERQITFNYHRWDGTATDVVANSYALVFKMGNWYAIAQNLSHEMHIYRVTRMVNVQLNGVRFQRDRTFDIHAYWHKASSQFVENIAIYPVTLELDTYTASIIEKVLPGRVVVVESYPGSIIVQAGFGSFEEARTMVMGLGRGAWVIAPRKLRQSVVEQAEAVVQYYRNRENQSSED